jgi:hypothetical protein
VLAPKEFPLSSRLEGEPDAHGDRTLLLGPTSASDPNGLRGLLPWLYPQPLGTRAFAGIRERHDVWRRATCDWPAGMVMTGMMDAGETEEMVQGFAHGLDREAVSEA